MASEEQHSGDAAYRQYLPDLTTPRFTTMQTQDAHEYAKAFKEGGVPPWLHGLYLHWQKLYQEPFKGITNDGRVRPDLFRLQDEGMPITAIVSAANTLLSHLTPSQHALLTHHIDSPEWRTWSNPEFLLSPKGLRLDTLPAPTRTAALALLSATLSPEGYAKALAAMRINGFLGTLVRAPRVLNEHSYNLALFGTPSATQPWGFSFYGHHLCLNVFLHQTQVVIAPWFTGAEPNVVDDPAAAHAGTRILQEEERLGLRLMQALVARDGDDDGGGGGVARRARVYAGLRDGAMPRGRWNHDDQRHLCGAYRDNRVVPYEGVVVGEMEEGEKELVRGILREYLLYLPERAREIRMGEVERWFGETYFCWIGGYGEDDAFYYRIQSPVVIVEFDHHSGVFLTNKEPAKFHIHTLLRMPNGGDYGMALRPLIPGIEQEYLWEGERE